MFLDTSILLLGLSSPHYLDNHSLETYLVIGLVSHLLEWVNGGALLGYSRPVPHSDALGGHRNLSALVKSASLCGEAPAWRLLFYALGSR